MKKKRALNIKSFIKKWKYKIVLSLLLVLTANIFSSSVFLLSSSNKGYYSHLIENKLRKSGEYFACFSLKENYEQETLINSVNYFKNHNIDATLYGVDTGLYCFSNIDNLLDNMTIVAGSESFDFADYFCASNLYGCLDYKTIVVNQNFSGYKIGCSLSLIIKIFPDLANYKIDDFSSYLIDKKIFINYKGSMILCSLITVYDANNSYFKDMFEKDFLVLHENWIKNKVVDYYLLASCGNKRIYQALSSLPFEKKDISITDIYKNNRIDFYNSHQLLSHDLFVVFIVLCILSFLFNIFLLVITLKKQSWDTLFSYLIIAVLFDFIKIVVFKTASFNLFTYCFLSPIYIILLVITLVCFLCKKRFLKHE